MWAIADERSMASVSPTAGSSWETTFTYLIMFHTEHLRDMSGCDELLESQLNQLACCEEITLPRLGRVFALRLLDHQLFERATLRTARPTLPPPVVPRGLPRAPPGAPAPRAPRVVPRATSCVLCLSTDHIYSNPEFGGAWEHTDRATITVACQCGRVHARLGPLSTPCIPLRQR